MASSHIHPPGTPYGPCVEACTHRDCAQSRMMAAKICRFCKRPIGYNALFYSDPEDTNGLVHAGCYTDDLERRQNAAHIGSHIGLPTKEK